MEGNSIIADYQSEQSFYSVIEDPNFTTITDIAKTVFNAPYAVITHFDGKSLTVTDNVKFRKMSVPLEKSFCGITIKRRETFVVEDALLEDRVKDNPYVIGRNKFRFYAGAPLIFENGEVYGTICIFDTKPRSFSLYEKTLLNLLATQVVSFLKFHHQAKRFERISKELEVANIITRQSDAILNTMHDGVLVHDANGMIIGSNPSACRILGYNSEKLTQIDLHNSCWEFFDEFKTPLPLLQQPAIIALREKSIVENRVIGAKRTDGDIIWLQISATPMFIDDNLNPDKVVVSFTDITKEKENSEHLKEMTNLAEMANQAKSNFLANMSHEIRTPLNGVIGIADALSRTVLDNSQKEMVDLIKNSGKSLETILNDVLDLSKIEAGYINIENNNLDIRHCVSSAAKLIKIHADEKNIEFNIDFAKDLKPNFIGDEIRIKQIVLNLASNAVKFTEKGSVTISVSPLSEGSGFEIAVKDTGIGISEDKLATIFTRFMQADETITRKFGGTGLGLAICRDLLGLMGGSLNVESKVGEGTIFTATFPLTATEQTTNISQNDEDVQYDDLGTYKILLVEDNLANQKVFQIITEPLDFEITIANNGKEAVEIYQQQSFDFIFMDMQMPVLDGIQATKQIREIERSMNLIGCNIIMLSANNSSHHIKLSKDAGANSFISKPFDLHKIIDVLEKLLENPDNKNYDNQVITA